MAPATLNRSCIIVFISALSPMPSRKSRASLGPNAFAGRMKIGTSTRATSVICHERTSIETRTRPTRITLPTMFESRSVNACWAPMMSLFSRLISAPVWVLAKKEIGIDWTCRKTLARMS